MVYSNPSKNSVEHLIFALELDAEEGIGIIMRFRAYGEYIIGFNKQQGWSIRVLVEFGSLRILTQR